MLSEAAEAHERQSRSPTIRALWSPGCSGHRPSLRLKPHSHPVAVHESVQWRCDRDDARLPLGVLIGR